MASSGVEQSTRVCMHPGGCPLPAAPTGWCKPHQQRVRRSGSPGSVEIPTRGLRRTGCVVPGCTFGHDGHGFCSTHRRRWLRDGDIDRGRPAGGLHPNWVGDQITYNGAHQRVAYQRGPAIEWSCAHCACPAQQWAYDHSDSDELWGQHSRTGERIPYSADPDHYLPLCISCHGVFDRTHKKERTTT